ncbi:MAG: mersacidin/lichenicidin family type 2 lantibiotic [Gemmataceae bacterium]|nr:mersacidin/lichenicidin family type 2 lantibiotic [Gemmataceae bacterium]
MSVENIIRAWKDEDFRRSLSAAERARLPEHPAGLIDLTAAELHALTGGYFAPTNTCTELGPACSVLGWF